MFVKNGTNISEMTEAFVEAYDDGEYRERLQLTELLTVLHQHKDNALQLQQDLLESHSRALQPNNAANYVVTFLEEVPQIPANHYRIIFGPQYKSPQYGDIDRIIARFPMTNADLYPDRTVTTDRTQSSWNDVFIELQGDNGEHQNYLLNSKGFVPFETGDNVVADMSYDTTGDLFSVLEGTTETRVSTDIFTLNYLLSYSPENRHTYVYHQQTNEINPPKQF